MGRDRNEFEPLQSDTRVAALEQKISEALATVDSKLQELSSTQTRLERILNSDQFKTILNNIDTGNDEAEAGTVQGESGARSRLRVEQGDNAHAASNAFKTSVSAIISQEAEKSGNRIDKKNVMDHDFQARLSSERFFQDIIRLKMVAGEVDPDTIVTVMKALNTEK